MSQDIRIIVLGTSHPLQCGNKICTEEEIKNFKECLKHIISDYNVKCIVEEMNDEGLKNHEAVTTVAYDLSIELKDIKHKYADLSCEHLCLIKINEGKRKEIEQNR